MNRLKKIETFYNWLCLPCPILIDVTIGVISLVCISTVVCGIVSMIWWVFGWYIFLLLFVALIAVTCVHLVYAKKTIDGGIKGWWKDKP